MDFAKNKFEILKTRNFDTLLKARQRLATAWGAFSPSPQILDPFILHPYGRRCGVPTVVPQPFVSGRLRAAPPGRPLLEERVAVAGEGEAGRISRSARGRTTRVAARGGSRETPARGAGARRDAAMDKPGMQAAPAAAANGGEEDESPRSGPRSGPRRRWRAAGGGRLRGSTPRVGGGAGTVAADAFAGEGREPRRMLRRRRGPGQPRLLGRGAARRPRSRTPRQVEQKRKGGETARRGRGHVDGREERRLRDKAAKKPCRTSLRTMPRLRGRREGKGRRRAPPGASPRDSRRTQRRPSRAKAARTVAGHVVAKEAEGRGEVGGGRLQTRPPQGMSPRTTPRWQEDERRDRAPLTKLR